MPTIARQGSGEQIHCEPDYWIRVSLNSAGLPAARERYNAVRELFDAGPYNTQSDCPAKPVIIQRN